MDRSSLKFFPSLATGGGAFLPQKTKVAGNCMKWIDPVLKYIPYIFCHKKGRSGLGGGLFCHKIWGKKFSVMATRGAFLPQKTKVAGNCMKWIDTSSVKNNLFPSCYRDWRGEGFSATKNQSCWKLHEMEDFTDSVYFRNGAHGYSTIIPWVLSWGLFCHKNPPKLLEIAWNG